MTPSILLFLLVLGTLFSFLIFVISQTARSSSKGVEPGTEGEDGKPVDMRIRKSALKEESKRLSFALRLYWVILFIGGFSVLWIGRSGNIVLFLAIFIIVFILAGRILANRYKAFYAKKGDFYFDGKKYESALECYRRITEVKGHSTDEAVYKTALCLDKMGEVYKAIGAYESYLHYYRGGKWKGEAQKALENLREGRKNSKTEVAEESPKESAKEESPKESVKESLQKKVSSVLEKIKETKEFSSRFQKDNRVGDYILEAKLNEGGFGEVWRARHHLFEDRKVALKIPTNLDYISNLKKLGVIQNSLKSPHIVRPENIDTESDPPYLAMEYIEGVDLKELLEHGEKLSIEEVLHIFLQIIEALKEAHHHGVVHRDLKPANILVDCQGHVKLTDFELGKINALTTSFSLSQSKEEGLQGTLLYMAPEQMRGEEVDQRTDIYSLGVILFEMIAGELPQPGDCLEDFDSRIPEALEVVFEGSYTRLEKRFNSVEEIQKELEKL